MTSNVDPVNESLIQDAITELAKNRTVLVVAHHLKTIQKADQILVFQKGSYLKREAWRTSCEKWLLHKIMESSVRGMIMILLKDVSYEWKDGRTALKNINLEIKKGEFYFNFREKWKW